MASVRYYGFPRVRNGIVVGYTARTQTGDTVAELPLRDDLSKHADAFAWGPTVINGRESKAMKPGAAQLALAILCHALRNDGRAAALHQRFKFRAMSKWKVDEAWSMTVEEVVAVCDKIEEDEPSAGQLDAIRREVAPMDREPSAGRASAITSVGHRNDIPGEKVDDDD